MKAQKKLNVVLVILTVVLLALVSFGGIYYNNKGAMTNYIPNYLLGTDLKGYRQVIIKIAESEDENKNESSEESQASTENESNSSEEQQNTQQEQTESEENKNTEQKYYREDFIKSADIIKKRLNSLKVNDYSVSCDEHSGNLVVNLPENDQTDIILSDLAQTGKFSVKDSSTQEELLNNEDVRNVVIGTQTTQTGKQTYMSIYFTTNGTEKLKNVSLNHRNLGEENQTAETNTVNEVNETNTVEESTEESSADSENKEETKKNQVTFNIDESTLMTTEFSEIIDNGVLTLTLGAKGTEQSKDELYSAYNLAAIIENSSLPVKYEVTGNTYVASVIGNDEIKAIIYIEIAVAAVIVLVLIAKFRLKGILSGIMATGFLAILLIVLRYANVTISLEGLFAIGIGFVINSVFYFLMCKYMNEEYEKEAEKVKQFKKMLVQYTCILIPELVMAVIFCFTQWAPLLSFGMIIFWSVAISWIYNALVSKLVS